MLNKSSIINQIKRTILIVDDEEINLTILSEILSSKYDVLTARDGIEALDVLHSSVTPISLIMLDLVMPKMNGKAFLKEIKAEDEYKRIPVIVLTSEKTSELESLKLGAADFIPKPYDIPEIILARVDRLIELSESRFVVQAAERDDVTGAYSKQVFSSYVEKMDRYQQEVDYDLLVLNIDRFHLFNELYGREQGDHALRTLGDCLKEIARSHDGIVGRLASDYFVMYLRRNGDYAGILQFINNQLSSLAKGYSLSIRMGVYQVNEKDSPVDVRIDKAKAACDSLRGRREHIRLFDQASQDKIVFEERLLQSFQEALKEKQFVLHYQPKIDVTGDTPRLGGAEALVRWKHPEFGMVSPGVFIPLLEEHGLISLLDQYVWKETCRQIEAWHRQYGVLIPVSANVSRIDLLNPSAMEEIKDLLKETGMDPHCFHLEITESAYVSDPKGIVDVVESIRQTGFQIEIDDFGSGYSSLNTLATFPLDALKLDIQFVRAMDQNEKARKMVDIVADIAKLLGCTLIAEGVETKEQMEYLKSKGYQLIQGYYFSKPLPADEFAKKYLE